MLIFSIAWILFVHVFVLSLAQTIGQAYEDMQMQNQRLLQQVTERDDYNIKVWFMITSFLSELSYESPQPN